jgi:hypothetical protein
MRNFTTRQPEPSEELQQLADLAAAVSDILQNPITPVRLYNALSDELIDIISNQIDHTNAEFLTVVFTQHRAEHNAEAEAEAPEELPANVIHFESRIQ